MDKSPFLSICITTYNRSEYLKQLLDSIVSQEWFWDEVEIMIYNDPDTDDTQSMVKKYQEKYPNIRYHRNEVRIGMMPSMLNAISMCVGKYVWLFSDDDMMSDIAIKTIMDVAKQQNPWLILSKILGFWNGTKIDSTKIDRHWRIVNIVWMENFFEFLAKAHYDVTPYLMHFSIFCLRKDLYLQHLHRILTERWEGYMNILSKDYFAHSRIMYLPLWDKEKITIVERNLVLVRGGNVSRSFGFKVLDDLKKLIRDLNNTYKINKKANRKMQNMYNYWLFMYIIQKHIKKYMPKFLFEMCVNMWRHLITFIKYIKSKIHF